MHVCTCHEKALMQDFQSNVSSRILYINNILVLEKHDIT